MGKLAVAAVISLAAGILSSMGMGGGGILIMLLACFSGFEQQRAQGVNLLYFIPVAALAVIRLRKEKLLETKTALLLAAGGVPLSVISSMAAVSIRGGTMRTIFGGCVLAYGIVSLAVVTGRAKNGR